MTEGIPFDLRHGGSSEVERCRCPLGYTGLSCEVCKVVFAKSLLWCLDVSYHGNCNEIKLTTLLISDP